jgi:hypothetical protein
MVRVLVHKQQSVIVRPDIRVINVKPISTNVHPFHVSTEEHVLMVAIHLVATVQLDLPEHSVKFKH